VRGRKGVWRSLNFSKWGKDNADIEDKSTGIDEQECQGRIMSDFLIRRARAMAERVTVPTSAIFEFQKGNLTYSTTLIIPCSHPP
jgi:hypothetical protein